VGTIIQSEAAKNGAAIDDANFANGTVRSIYGNDGTNDLIKIDAMGTFPSLGTLYDSSGTSLNITTAAFTANTSKGYMSFQDTTSGVLYTEYSTGGFQSNVPSWVRGQSSGGFCRVTAVNDIKMNSIVPKIPEILHASTNIGWSSKNTSSSLNTLSNEWGSIGLGINNEFLNEEKKIYSFSNNPLSQSLYIRAQFNSTTPYVSPIVDTTRMNGIIIHNIINSDSTNENEHVGNALTRYISKRVELADGQDAEDMLVYVNAFKPVGTDVEVYAKILHSEDVDFDSKDYSLMRQVTDINTFSTGIDGTNIREYEYTFSANTDGSNFLGSNSDNQAKLNTTNSNIVGYRSKEGGIFHTYKVFAIKLVLKANSSNIVPLVNDLRVIALQK
jgi:hypothetical protein